MKAAVVTSFHRAVELQERPVPLPPADHVLVRIEACGLCHTDIHAAHGDWPVTPSLPFVPGHEGVGIVESIGDGVANRKIGERVAIAWLGYACGECRYCIDGRETLCLSQRNSGYSTDGAFAEYAVVHARFAVPVPATIAPIEAAPLVCAGVTTYKALKVAHIVPAETVAVFGIGGLGHLAIQYARLFGATVIAVDIEPEKLTMALELGANHVIDASANDLIEKIAQLGGVDAAIVLAPSAEVFQAAFTSLNRGGRLICVGLPAGGTMTFPIFDLVLKGISVIGSIVGTRQDLREVFDLHAAGRTRVITQSFSMDTINDQITRVERGAVPARMVMEFLP